MTGVTPYAWRPRASHPGPHLTRTPTRTNEQELTDDRIR